MDSEEKFQSFNRELEKLANSYGLALVSSWSPEDKTYNYSFKPVEEPLFYISGIPFYPEVDTLSK